MGHVLVANREPTTCELLRVALAKDGYEVAVATERAQALTLEADFDVVVADIELDLLTTFRARNPSTQVVVMSAATSLNDALAAVRDGAFDFVLRPFYVEDISLTVACAAARRRGGLDCALSYVYKNSDLLR